MIGGAVIIMKLGKHCIVRPLWYVYIILHNVICSRQKIVITMCYNNWNKFVSAFLILFSLKTIGLVALLLLLNVATVAAKLGALLSSKKSEQPQNLHVHVQPWKSKHFVVLAEFCRKGLHFLNFNKNPCSTLLQMTNTSSRAPITEDPRTDGTTKAIRALKRTNSIIYTKSWNSRTISEDTCLQILGYSYYQRHS